MFLKSVAVADRARREDVAHVHAHFANHPATAAWIVHRLTGLPFSFTAHANDMFLSPPLLRQKVDEAAFVVTISEYNEVLLNRMTPRSPIRVVHCGVDTATLARIVRPRRGRRVLCVASLEPRKGHRDLLEAFAELAAHDAELHLTLVGDGPERDAIVGHTRALGISDRVELTGPLSADDVRRELAAADVFVLASVADHTGRTEGIPVALMEAMAAGVPVVATRISGIPELVEGVGRLVEPGAADELAAAISGRARRQPPRRGSGVRPGTRRGAVRSRSGKRRSSATSSRRHWLCEPAWARARSQARPPRTYPVSPRPTR